MIADVRVASAVVIVVAAVATCAVGGCKDKPPPTTIDAAAPPPPDHLAPGELAEGKQKAFGLTLPGELTIAREGQWMVNATSQTARPEQVANYFRARVVDGNVAVGAVDTKFVRVHAKGEPKRDLTIEVRPGLPGYAACEVLIRDVTPPPTEPGLTDEERKKRAGLGPDGKLLDPKHLE